MNTGRFADVAREMRICRLCNSAVEDELHFLFQCKNPEMNTLKIELYHQLLPELLNHENDFIKFREINNHPHIFGKYITRLWDKRAQIVYNNV